MFGIDAKKEELSIKEANVLGIPVVAVLDSNVSPDGIAFPVPANDDAARAIRLYCDAVAQAATRGGQQNRSEEHRSELQSLMRISYAVFCLKKKKNRTQKKTEIQNTENSHREHRS